MDVYCANPECQEPWDALGFNDALNFDQGDMTQEEAKLFRDGKGCPSCHFGFPDLSLRDAIERARPLPPFPFMKGGSKESRQQGQVAAITTFESMMEGSDDPDSFLDLLGDFL